MLSPIQLYQNGFTRQQLIMKPTGCRSKPCFSSHVRMCHTVQIHPYTFHAFSFSSSTENKNNHQTFTAAELLRLPPHTFSIFAFPLLKPLLFSAFSLLCKLDGIERKRTLDEERRREVRKHPHLHILLRASQVSCRVQ